MLCTNQSVIACLSIIWSRLSGKAEAWLALTCVAITLLGLISDMVDLKNLIYERQFLPVPICVVRICVGLTSLGLFWTALYWMVRT